MTFEFNLTNFNFIKKRFLMNKVDNIIEKMQSIVKYARINVMNINKIILARINKHRKFIEYEIKNYV